MPFKVYDTYGRTSTEVYSPQELNQIVTDNITYYSNRVEELQNELNKTKEELRKEVYEEYKNEISALKKKLHFSIAKVDTEKELEKYKDFFKKHKKCRCKSLFDGGRVPIIIQTEIGIDTCTEIQCPICGEKKDITDIGTYT